jgi:predicted permease
MFQDLRFGLKLLWKEKAFTFAALLTLALCIGANTAIFTVLKSVVLAPLPFPESDRIVTMYNIYPGVGVERGANGVPDYLDRRKMSDVFESVALMGQRGYDVGAQGSVIRLEGAYVTPSYFTVLRSAPVLGRAFLEEDAVLGKDKSAILSYGLWEEMFSRDRAVLGKDIRLSGVPYRIIGVMPESFRPVDGDERLWVPFAFTPQQTSDDARHSNSWGMIARLRTGMSLTYAQQRIDALNKGNLDKFPKYRDLLIQARFGTKAVFLKDELVRNARPLLYLLQAAVGFVLLIGCVNVANLMLVRANVRMKELAIRFSLGADWWRIGRQLLTESVTIGMLGGALGIAVGYAGVRALTSLSAKYLPTGMVIRIDPVVLAVSGAIALGTGLAFGLLPVFHLVRRDLNEVFRQNGRTGTTERGALWTRSALVVAQVALAFVLLTGSGLLTISFAKLLSVNPGFKPDHVATAQFSLPDSRYKDDAAARSFIDRLTAGLRAIPGIGPVGVTGYLPFSGNNNSSLIWIEGRPLGSGELPPVPGWNMVDSGYLRAMGIPLLRGRNIADSDAAGKEQVVVIDQFLAKKYWPKSDPIGQKIRRGDDKGPLITIVGVVGSVKTDDLAEKNPVGQIYFSYKQFVPRAMHVVIRSDRDDPHLVAAVRAQLLEADPELALFDVKTMPERMAASVAPLRAAMIICLVFAGLPLLLSAIGIYGVLAYAVTQRTREFGIRMALGADTRRVLTMVLGQGIRLAAVGLIIGVATAFGLTRLMASLLFNIKPGDPRLYLLAALVLMMVAAAASLVPSIRAVRVRPASALRSE